VQLGRAIADVFAAVYGDPGHSPAERLAKVVVVVLTWMVALALVVVLGVVVAFLPPAAPLELAWPAVLFVTLALAFLPTYLVFPADVSLREVVPGAAVAAAAWTASGLLFRAYAATATSVEFFGVVGAVLLLLTWLSVGSLALVAGAVTNAVLTDALADTQT
jgi:membrane protein